MVLDADPGGSAVRLGAPDGAGGEGTVKAVRISEIPLVMSGHQVIEFSGGDKGLVASPDRRHVAYVFRHEDGRQAVAVDPAGPVLRLDPWQARVQSRRRHVA